MIGEEKEEDRRRRTLQGVFGMARMTFVRGETIAVS